MRAHRIILALALLMIGGLSFLTIAVVVEHGPDPLILLSLLILALFGFGIVGALLQTPDDD